VFDARVRVCQPHQLALGARVGVLVSKGPTDSCLVRGQGCWCRNPYRLVFDARARMSTPPTHAWCEGRDVGVEEPYQLAIDARVRECRPHHLALGARVVWVSKTSAVSCLEQGKGESMGVDIEK